MALDFGSNFSRATFVFVGLGSLLHFALGVIGQIIELSAHDTQIKQLTTLH
jgi:hypothetical protein